jgi:hypothetical protein
MKVYFYHPPTKTTNPLVDFEPWNGEHYPTEKETGVYIYGIRVKIDGHLKFVPIVVGEGVLFKRLYKDHYLGKFSNPLATLLGHSTKNSGDAKELWDFSNSNLTVSELEKIYLDIDSYDKALGKRGKLSLVAKLPNLIFFQDSNFFHLKHTLSPVEKNINIKIEESIDYLMDILVKGHITKTKDIREHVSRILLTLGNFRDRFYYVYASAKNNLGIDFTDKGILLSIEKQTKDKLKKINIFTSADERVGTIMDPIGIDLSQIQNELVNIGEHDFNNSNGSYSFH